jgi:MFS family permease
MQKAQGKSGDPGKCLAAGFRTNIQEGGIGMVTKETPSNIGNVRWSIPFTLMATVIIAYLDRANLSLALPKIAESYGWTAAQTGEYGGMLMSIFYVAYGLANIFISPLGEKFGPRKSLICLVVLWSLFTALGGAFGLLFVPFIITRILLGLGEGIHWPMMNMLTKVWFPMNERSRGNGIYAIGMFAAGLLGPILLVPLVNMAGWRWMFGILGIIGLTVSIPLIYFFIYDNPRKHPRISEAETAFIENGMEKEDGIERGTLWQEVQPFIRSGAFWFAVLVGSLNNMFAHGLMNWMPTYFTKGRGLPFGDLWYAVSLPFVACILGVITWSYLGDKTNRRVIVSCIGPFVAALFVYISVNQGAIAGTIIAFLFATFFGMTYASNEFAIVQHILPKRSVVTGVGVYNGLTMLIGGGLGPVVVGTAVSMTGSYQTGILALAGVSCITGIAMFALYRFVKY